MTGALGLLITISFFTATYDTAQVKLTLLHMGGWLLIGLWAALKIAQRTLPFTRKNLPFLLPVFVYMGWNILCYIFAPYHAEAAEEFIRFLLYGLLTLLAATEFSLEDIKTITRWFLAAMVVSFAYATVQIADGFFPGVDPMPWHGFFTKRIFATHANPNFFADFAVFASFIAAGVFFVQRKKSLLVLLGIGLIALFFTESKGAWLAYAATACVGTWIYINYFSPTLKRYRGRINCLAIVAVLGVLVLVGMFTVKRFQSVSFRTHTWLGTFEMIKDHPVMGVGIGNFKTLYTAYRRPQIFYIENSHNTETQHAENELLEQWAVSGTVGLAIFLWLIYCLLISVRKAFMQEELSRERKFYLFGYSLAFIAILLHSLVDISLHFASTGFFFALCMGFMLSLSGNTYTVAVKQPQPSAPWLVYVLRAVVSIGVVCLDIWLFMCFQEVMSVLTLNNWGEFLCVAFAWIVFIGCLGGASYVLCRAAWTLPQAPALAVLLFILPVEALAYCPFQANHYYSVGVTLYRLQNLEGALGYFTKAIEFNPLQAEYRQFRANVLAVTLNLTRQFSPLRGDKNFPSDDFTRALQDFNAVEKFSPNHPLLHHNRGQLYYALALRRADEAPHARSAAEYDSLKKEAWDKMALAQASFERSLATDPTHPDTYFFLVQIALLENKLDLAQEWIDRFKTGPDGKGSEFLKQPPIAATWAALQAQVNARRGK